ncbi:MAG: hypothetical protein COS99_04865 [Candidatus Omnitrophica bacterium CG07_land_8_20_14_0_80_42_15]|uniref:Uncharacterized protein n=1 Tax=Candidatus Aquitaenariimonas noxiae TaxID=1974741 RepID=A0A2J0KYS5_9BACT|nr:MAG: hypothetical protein COS99_04865 [Candidatus Omnitrophica bacterium CG07_land_8_20_14_0_80_42_15]
MPNKKNILYVFIFLITYCVSLSYAQDTTMERLGSQREIQRTRPRRPTHSDFTSYTKPTQKLDRAELDWSSHEKVKEYRKYYKVEKDSGTEQNNTSTVIPTEDNGEVAPDLYGGTDGGSFIK